MAQEGIIPKTISEARIAGIPVGAAATGALTAGLVDGVTGLIEGVAGTTIPKWAMSGIGAFAVVKWGSKWLGNTAAQTAGLLLTYDAIQELVDLRGMVKGLFGGITPTGIRVVTNSGGRVAPVPPAPVPAKTVVDTVDEYLKARGV